VAHYNAPRFYAELKDSSPRRFSIVVGTAYAIAALAFIIVAFLGFLTFGGNSAGLILNNYASTDLLATFSRAAVALSLVFTYPIAFLGFRDGVLSLPCLQPSDDEIAGAPEQLLDINVLSVVLLSVVTLVAANVQDLRVVLSVGGGTFSTAVATIFPALMYRGAVDKMGESASASDMLAANIALSLMWVGIAVGMTGVTFALKA